MLFEKISLMYSLVCQGLSNGDVGVGRGTIFREVERGTAFREIRPGTGFKTGDFR